MMNCSLRSFKLSSPPSHTSARDGSLPMSTMRPFHWTKEMIGMRQLTHWFGRNLRFELWVSNPEMVPCDLWPEALQAASNAGEKQLLQSLLWFSGHDVGLKNQASTPKRSSFQHMVIAERMHGAVNQLVNGQLMDSHRQNPSTRQSVVVLSHVFRATAMLNSQQRCGSSCAFQTGIVRPPTVHNLQTNQCRT